MEALPKTPLLESVSVHTPPFCFENFYRQCVRRILVLNAKSKGEVLASPNLKNSLLTQRRRQLKQHAQVAYDSNRRLEDVVLEVTETPPAGEDADEADVKPFLTGPSAAGRSFADATAAIQPSTSSTYQNTSRQAQSASQNPPSAKFVNPETSWW